jgi:arylsulfatase A-like enzyme
VAGLLLAGPVQGFAAAAKRPNIVLIFSDDHGYQAVSAYREARRLIQTPNIDRLAREGMRFDRCLVTNSICGPSRATVLTGKYSHLNGFYNNSNSRFDSSQTTFPKLLQAAGYQTALIGKWHLVSDPTGFDHWQILPGQGVYYDPPMIRNGEKIQEHGYVTDVITDRTLDWLKGRDRERPFLLMMQHKAPHRDWQPAIRDLKFDADRHYPEPLTLFDDYAGRGVAEHDQDMTIDKTMNDRDLKLVPPPKALDEQQRLAWQAYYDPRNASFRQQAPKGRDLVHWKYERYMHDYLACVKAVDDSVGRLLRYLDDEGLVDNTIVIYTSDQGFFMGEHGWFDKRWIFEESLRTPLLVRWPGAAAAGSSSSDIVSNLDLAETFLDAAGLPVPGEMQGRSLVPVLQGKTPADWRKSFYYHYYEYPQPHHVRPHYGVVTNRYKLIHFYDTDADYWELFDLQNDPHEMKSVYDSPDYTEAQKKLADSLARLQTKLKVPAHDPPQASGQPLAGRKPKKAKS